MLFEEEWLLVWTWRGAALSTPLAAVVGSLKGEQRPRAWACLNHLSDEHAITYTHACTHTEVGTELSF